MSVPFRSVGGVANGSSVSSLSVGAPTGIVADDLLLACTTHGVSTNNSVCEPPSGWSEVIYNIIGVGPYTNIIFEVWEKTATGSEPGSYDFAFTQYPHASVFIADYFGVTVDVSETTASGDSTTFNPASVTTKQVDEAVLVYFVSYLNGFFDAPPPSPLTTRVDVNVGFGGYGNVKVQLSDYVGPNPAGSSAPGTWTYNDGGDGWPGAITLSLSSPFFDQISMVV